MGEVQADFHDLVNFEKEPEGVFVNAKDVKRASIMNERKKPEYAVILAFDVKVTPEAKREAESLGVKLMTADIIYHLFDQFTAYMNGLREAEKQEKMKGAF